MARAALVLYLAWLALATLSPAPGTVPTPAGDGRVGLGAVLGAVNLVPLHVIRETVSFGWGWLSIKLLLGNVLVFVPFGLLAPVAWRRLAGWTPMAVAGLTLSLGVELSQLAGSLALGRPYRSTDVDDVLLNVAGVVLGFALYRVTGRRPGGEVAANAGV